jgi:hypothetical protein
MFSISQHVRRKLFWVVAALCVCVLSKPGLAASGCSAASFNVASNITLWTTPYNIVASDFNPDGHTDLATVDTSAGEVIVLLSRGGVEGFGPASNFPAGVGASGIAGGDFNGDGKPDLVTSSGLFGATTGSLSIPVGNGNGTFSAPALINDDARPGISINANFYQTEGAAGTAKTLRSR